MNSHEPLKQRPFESLGRERLVLLGRRRVVPAWQSGGKESAGVVQQANVEAERRPELEEPAKPAETVTGMKKRRRKTTLTAARAAELVRRSASEKHGDLAVEFDVAKSTIYRLVNEAKKMAGPARGEELSLRATATVSGAKAKAPGPEMGAVLDALAAFIDARVERKLDEAFGRLRGK